MRMLLGLLFSIGAVVALFVLFAVIFGTRVQAQTLEGYRHGVGLTPICQNASQIVRVVELRKAGQSWNAAVFAVNFKTGTQVCAVSRLAFLYQGQPAANVVLQGTAWEVRPVMTVAVFWQGMWVPFLRRTGFVAIQSPSTSL